MTSKRADQSGEQTTGADEAAEAVADLLAFALTARHERVEDGMVALGPPHLREALRGTREAIAVLGRQLAPSSPASSVRERLLRSMKQRTPRRAILVVDMINDHLQPGTVLEVPRARAVVPALQERLAAARAAGIPVVYVVDEHEPNDPDFDAWGTHAIRGTSGGEVWEPLAPSRGDVVVKKPSYSAFFGSNLSTVLDELDIDTLELTGCLTEIGLAATAVDAMQRGFAVEIPPATQAGSCAEVEAVAIGTLRVMAPFGPARVARLERRAA